MGATLLSPKKILREKSAPAPHALRVDRPGVLFYYTC